MELGCHTPLACLRFSVQTRQWASRVTLTTCLATIERHTRRRYKLGINNKTHSISFVQSHSLQLYAVVLLNDYFFNIFSVMIE